MLTVLSVAYPFAPVSRDAVGGAEQVLATLDEALVRAGCRSVVVAREDSTPRGRLVPIPRVAGVLTEERCAEVHRRTRAAVREALERWPVDVIHAHGIDFHRYLPPAGPPLLVTLHLPPAWYAPEAFRVRRPETYLHCVSLPQHWSCPPGTRLLPPVPNGVDVDRLPAPVSRRRYTLALGRVCPEKGFEHALDASRLAGVPMLLAGEVYPYAVHQRYFHDQVRPRLDAERRFVGPVGFRRKRRLLSAARCLLVPSLADETSSLVAMEALACGTPVIAYKKGALPYVVDHGRTGFMVDDPAGMADAIRAADRIDPRECRRAARERFSSGAMVELYFETYRLLADEERLAAAAGRVCEHAA
ncbi:MAG TPA: glycosyltransferase [Longimicrobium sp.]|jgi:glycosyltransferase involved in cell wall biosynthesis|nr:glycosyltransferase [Longimicrobium sp.]